MREPGRAGEKSEEGGRTAGARHGTGADKAVDEVRTSQLRYNVRSSETNGRKEDR
jgi:hypothetical protein